MFCLFGCFWGAEYPGRLKRIFAFKLVAVKTALFWRLDLLDAPPGRMFVVLDASEMRPRNSFAVSLCFIVFGAGLDVLGD
jgi:hypothetical protein